MNPNLLFFISALVAEIFGTFAGFGATTLLLPIALFLFPLKEAIVLVAFFHFLGTFFRSIIFVRKINLKIVVFFGIPSLVFSMIGANLLAIIEPFFLTKVVGVLLIGYASYSLFKERILISKSKLVLGVGGSIVGFLAGLIGTAGALRGAFLTAWNLSPQVYLATGALMGLGVDSARVFVYWQNGLINLEKDFLIWLILIALGGVLIGRFLVKRTKEKIFSKIIFGALILAGLRLIFS